MLTSVCFLRHSLVAHGDSARISLVATTVNNVSMVTMVLNVISQSMSVYRPHVCMEPLVQMDLISMTSCVRALMDSQVCQKYIS